jgi:dephospho-CoA kinase
MVPRDAETDTPSDGALDLSPLVVGLTGPNAAGKGVAASYLCEQGFGYASLSDVVRRRALAAGLDTSRESLIVTGQRLRSERGPGVLAEEIVVDLPERAIVDSVRHPAEVAVLRAARPFRLLCVDAPLEVRWRRALDRGREGDVPDLETFRAREERENTDRPEAQQLRRVMALADATLVNDGSVSDLRRRVGEVVAAWIAGERAR